MDKIKLEIIGISHSRSQIGAYSLILGENGTERSLPIIIGGFEAQSIAVELENMKPSRPLTHDLFKSLAETFDIKLLEVIVYKFIEGIFYSKLICLGNSGKYEIDARTSDAVALAVRFKCPIYTSEEILGAAGIILKEKNKDVEKMQIKVQEKNEINTDNPQSEEEIEISIEELQKKLNQAIEREEYEKASMLRDEINKRKKEKS